MITVASTLLALALVSPLRSAPAPGPSAAPEATTVDPTTWGPYGVGVTTVTFVDPSRGDRELTTEIWYPAIVSPDSAGENYYHLGYGMATRDAPPILGETYPLVAFSHGNGAMRFQSIFYCEHLASHGYIVAAPDHQGNTFYDWDDQLTSQAPIDRPLDISFLLDQLLRLSRAGQEPVPGTIDADRIAITGHSFGGYTSLVVSGALLDMQAAKAGCAAGDNTACGAVAYAEELYGTDQRWVDVSDPRVSVSIPQAPGVYSYFGDEGLANVFTPTCQMASLEDGILPWEEEALPIHEALDEDKILMTLTHRGHYAFSSAWDVHPFQRRCTSIEDCPDRDPSHEVVNTLATAFLGYYLKGEEVWSPWLQEEYYRGKWPARVDYLSEGTP